MPQVNPLARELVFKVVYYGPGLGGKTTSLQHVHATTRPEHRGKMVSLATPVDRTLYFDFLPIRVPSSRNMTVRLQLFTVPGQVYYNATRKLVLTGADGVVFVADSQIERADANVESFRNLEENLMEHGRDLDEMPHVFAYNKRDLVELAPIEEMEQLLNSRGAPSFATVATSGEGVYETLEAITRAVLEDFDQRVPEHRGLSPSPLMLPEGGLAEALRLVDGAPESWDIPVESARPRPRMGSDPGFSVPPDEDLGAGEHAARIVLEQGTRPGVGVNDGERPIDLRRPKASSDAPPQRTEAYSTHANAGNVDSEAPPPSSETGIQSRWRPLPVPLNGIGMRSSPPPVSTVEPLGTHDRSPSEQPEHEEQLAEPSVSVPSSPPPSSRRSVQPAPQTTDLAEDGERGCSLSLLWPEDECATVLRVEQSIASGETRDAVLLSEILVERSIEDLGTRLGRTGLEPAVWVMLLGMRGESYIEFVRLTDRAKATQAKLSKAEALSALLFATNLCVAKRRATSQSLA